jgi:hypothetical protein
MGWYGMVWDVGLSFFGGLEVNVEYEKKAWFQPIKAIASMSSCSLYVQIHRTATTATHFIHNLCPKFSSCNLI